MRVVEVHVGRASSLRAGDRLVASAIRKSRVRGPVRVFSDHLEGDECADLRVHGGPARAVYAYPAEHYPAWRSELGDPTLAFGSFGENLTVEGLTEGEVHLGDRFALGTCELVVTRPRLPCFKLEAHLGRPEVGARMLETGRTGFYLGVACPGTLAEGDPIDRVGSGSGPTVSEAVRGRRDRESLPARR